MDKSVQKALNGLIKKIESVEKFSLKHAPDVAKEIIREAYVDAGSSFIFTALSMTAAYFSYSKIDAHSNDIQMAVIMTGIFLSVASIFSVVSLIYTNSLLVVYFCPKLFLLKSIRNLLSNSEQ